MAITTLPSGTVARYATPGVVNYVDHLYTWSGAANVDGDTIQICKLAPRQTIINVIVRSSDLGTTVAVDLGLDPAPGGTTATADVLADGLTGFATAAGDFNQLLLVPTVTSGLIVAGAGLVTHDELDSILYMTLVDAGETTTTGSIYTQVFFSSDNGRNYNAGVNA